MKFSVTDPAPTLYGRILAVAIGIWLGAEARQKKMGDARLLVTEELTVTSTHQLMPIQSYLMRAGTCLERSVSVMPRTWQDS
jgi:hypothetical protein